MLRDKRAVAPAFGAYLWSICTHHSFQQDRASRTLPTPLSLQGLALRFRCGLIWYVADSGVDFCFRPSDTRLCTTVYAMTVQEGLVYMVSVTETSTQIHIFRATLHQEHASSTPPEELWYDGASCYLCASASMAWPLDLRLRRGAFSAKTMGHKRAALEGFHLDIWFYFGLLGRFQDLDTTSVAHGL